MSLTWYSRRRQQMSSTWYRRLGYRPGQWPIHRPSLQPGQWPVRWPGRRLTILASFVNKVDVLNCSGVIVTQKRHKY